MRILFTGASSFTGAWFARELAAAGHQVVATLRQDRRAYGSVRGERVRLVNQSCEIVENCEFGSDTFMDLLGNSSAFDVLCHHAACVENYRSPDFDIAHAFSANTRRGREVLGVFRDRGGKAMVITGSVFEPGEGAGDFPLRAFSPYGVSKAITAEFFTYWCHTYEVPLGKFVIPNPFGPHEEQRFCGYLLQSWAKGEVPTIKTPEYVRDNIHVSLLAGAYVNFVDNVSKGGRSTSLHPSGYVETQGAFAFRFSRELAKRLGRDFKLNLARQTEYPEPLVRINFERAEKLVPSWSEMNAWDELTSYYDEIYFDVLSKRKN